MPYVISEPCINVKDRSCLDDCPVDRLQGNPLGAHALRRMTSLRRGVGA